MDMYMMPAGKGYVSANGGQIYVDCRTLPSSCIFNKEQAELMMKTYGLPVRKVKLGEKIELEDKAVQYLHAQHHTTKSCFMGDQPYDEFDGSDDMIKEYNLIPRYSMGMRLNLNGRVLRVAGWMTSNETPVEKGDWLSKDSEGNTVCVRSESQQ